jgi:hemerythrin superfamily protein
MDVFKTITSDHRQVEKVFDQLVQADDQQACRTLVFRLRDLFVPHMVAEQQLVYPLLDDIDNDQAHDLHMEADEEHHAADLVLQELLTTSPSDDHFKAKVTILQEMIQHHVEEEENTMLPMLQQHISKRRSAELGKHFTMTKNHVLGDLQGPMAA